MPAIKELFNIEKGTLQSLKNTPGNYDFITAGENWKTHNVYSHECEALIFAMGASGSLGRTHYVNGKFITSDLCFILTPTKQYQNSIDLKFYHTVFNFLRPEIVKKTATGTSKLSINLSNFGNYELPYFELSKQREFRILFDKIFTVDNELITEFENQTAFISKLRQSILQEAVMGKLVPQNPNDEPASVLLERIQHEKSQLIQKGKLKKDKPLSPIASDEIPYPLPKNWTWCRLGEVAIKVQDGTHFSPQLQYSEKKPKTFLYLTSKNIKDFGIELNGATYVDERVHKEITARCNPEYGDILLIKDGAMTGRVTVNNLHEDFSLLSSVALIKTNKANIENRFLMFYLRSPVGNSKIIGKMTGSAIPRIILEKVKMTIFPLPPLAEQKRIVEKVDRLMAWCDELEKNIQSSQSDAERLMQAVLKEAFEGKV